jgi:hypothetical protein
MVGTVMKNSIVIVCAGALVAAAIFIPKVAEAQPPQSKREAIDWPIGAECVLTFETQSWIGGPATPPGQASGIRPDYTIQGKITYWGPDWVVVKEGTYENWVARDKILTIRASR